MSERQARLKRKNEETKAVNVTKKSKADIITNLVIVLVVAALIGAGAWAIYNQYAPQPIPTIAEYAESIGSTAEDFLKEYGLDTNTEVTEDMEISLAIEYMTLANYAKLNGMEIDEVKESMGLDDTVDENTLIKDIYSMLDAKMQEAQDTNEEESEE